MKPFNNSLYKQKQESEIFKRISGCDKIYLEVGGKLFDDNHAKRVLPGFEPDVKMQILREIKGDLEVIFCINARDLIIGKVRADNNLTYGEEVIRLTKVMKAENIDVLGIMITFYEPHKNVLDFESRCSENEVKTYKSYFIENYPTDLDNILSANGFGKNDYVVSKKKIVLVSAPGANSGKMETCLSQIYNDKLHGITSFYAKYETFPVWNLSLDHLVNIAYEMATVDIKDKNMLDPFYSKTHGGETAVNYNRDIEAFPVLSKMFERIFGKQVYDSPTSMGINTVGFAIENDLEVQKAAFEEIKRRHEKHMKMFEEKKLSSSSLKLSEKLLEKSQKIMKKLLENS